MDNRLRANLIRRLGSAMLSYHNSQYVRLIVGSQLCRHERSSFCKFLSQARSTILYRHRRNIQNMPRSGGNFHARAPADILEKASVIIRRSRSKSRLETGHTRALGHCTLRPFARQSHECSSKERCIRRLEV